MNVPACALVLITITASSAAAVESTCDPGKSSSTITGPEPLTSELRRVVAAKGELLFQPGHFDEESFSYLGSVAANDHRWHVVYLSTTWGQSCRATHRLLVFREDHAYLGQYSHFSVEPVGVEGDRVIFGDGSSIHFDDSGPPAKILVNGDSLEFQS